MGFEEKGIEEKGGREGRRETVRVMKEEKGGERGMIILRRRLRVRGRSGLGSIGGRRI